LAGIDQALALFHDLLLALPLLNFDVANLCSCVQPVSLQALQLAGLDQWLPEHLLLTPRARQLHTLLGFAKCNQAVAKLAEF